MATIVIKISKTGAVEIDAQGFTGTSCASATEAIEKVLVGSNGKEDKKKPEFYAPPVFDTSSIFHR